MSEASKLRGSLPHGWIVKTSKKYPDRVYYFNVITGASTWECPELDYPKPVENKEDAHSKCIGKRKSMENDPVNKGDDSATLFVSNKRHSRTSSENLSEDENKKTPSVKKKIEAETPPTPADNSKSSVPPTAIVNPVVLERNVSESGASVRPKCDNLGFKVFKKPQKISPKSISSIPSTSAGLIKPACSEEGRPPGTSVLRTKFKSKLSKSSKFFKRRYSSQEQPSTSSFSTSESDSSDSDFSMPSEIEEPSSEFFCRHIDSPTAMHSESEDLSSDDIEMLDVTANLTKIDDMVFCTDTDKSACSYYLVVDTNIFINDLQQIDEIKDTPVEGCGPPHIFIPWIVIQELDNLKKTTVTASTTSRSAQKAVRYLNAVLKSKHPRFHGQSPQEAKDIAQTYSNCNDDRILECCLSLAEKIPQEKVILLTNDKNLVNKALICDIVVHDWESFMELVTPDVVYAGRSKAKKEKEEESKEEKPDVPKVNLEKKLVKKCEAWKPEVHTLMSESRQLLKNALIPLFKEEMDKAYGDLWLRYNIQVNILKELLNAIARFWITVFGLHFSDKDKRCFEFLKEKANKPEGFLGDRTVCYRINTAIEDILHSIKKKWADLEVPTEKIKNLKALCNETFDKYEKIDQPIPQVECVEEEDQVITGSNTESETNSVLKTFENNWIVINHLCGMIMDFYQLPHNYVYEKPSSVPSEIEFRRLMVNLYPCVEQLMQLMQGVVKLIGSRNPKSKPLFEILFKALNDFIPTLDIQEEYPHLPHFTLIALARFCYDPKNAERITYGCKQIEDFFSSLDIALRVMSIGKRDSNSTKPNPTVTEL